MNRTNPFSTQDYIYRPFNEFIIYNLYRSQHIYQYSVGVTEMVILTFHFLIINWYKHQPLYLVLDTVFKYRKVSLMTQALTLSTLFCTVVGHYINIMKTIFDLNFDFYQALNSMDTQKYGNKEKLSI